MMQKRVAWKLEKRKLADLKPHPKNPRQFTEKGMKDLENSINSIGFMQPININQDGTILSGHARTLKLKEMGEIEVDVYVPDRILTPKQEEEVLIRANANTAGQWDWDLLANNFEIEEISEWGLEVTDINLDEELEAKEDDFDGEPPTEPITVLGDLYEIGEHRLLCGDSTDSDQVAKLMNGSKADISFTSPPYNVGKTPNGNDKKYLNDNDNKSISEYVSLLDDFTKTALLFSDFVFSNIQSLSGNKIALIEHLYNLRSVYADVMIWDKKTAEPAMARKVLNSRFEYIYIFSNEAKRSIGKRDFRGTIDNIFQLNSRQGKDFAKIHKATFPIQLPEMFIKNFTETSVLDCFCGTGSTMVASHQLKRKCYGMELDPKYCDVIIKRMIKLDPSLKITRNGEDCKNEFIEKND